MNSRTLILWKRLFDIHDYCCLNTMSIKLLDFYADWCGPCKTQDPILDELEADYTEVAFEKINVDDEQDIANQYEVRSLPTVVVENDDGVVDRFIGVTQREDIEAAIQQAL
ncbi:MAG: thioredoxin [Haloquadratum walsbyi J07HQW2]|uniref:Thioredoxin n=2 Tax=Haloquadratum walsbyi TaxID=293091 RepID=U1NGR8_9EURY|nr:MAG: thioredoxin [Haloquadratum walsbyi J07HQW2]